MVAASKLLAPKELEVGALVQARDSVGLWYNAKVIEKTGRGASQAVTVRYIGFSKRWDEKFTAKQDGLREREPAAHLKLERDDILYGGRTDGRIAPGVWEILRIMKHMGGGAYLVRWVGWEDPEHDTIERNLPRAYIREFEEETEALASARKNPPKQPQLPFSLVLVAHESPALLETRILDCDDYISEIAAEIEVKTSRQKSPAAEKTLWKCKPVLPGTFHAMREKMKRMAVDMLEPENVDGAVTSVMKLRGGERPLDYFTLMDFDILYALMGDKIFTYHHNSTGAIWMMVPPFDFMYRGKLGGEDGELLPGKEMVCKGHYVGVVPDRENEGKMIFRADEKAYAYPAADLDAYQVSLAKIIINKCDTATWRDVPPPPIFRAWAAETLAAAQ